LKETTMKLFYAETLNPRRACAVAKYLGAPVEFVLVDLARAEQRSPSFLAVNPNGRVPALIDGDTRLWEADAIMCHLARAADSDLWPDDARQTDVLRWLSWNTQHFTRHAGTLYFEHLIKPKFGMGAPDQKAIEEATGYFRRSGRILDAHLRGRDTLVGDGLTIADFAMASALPYASDAQIPFAEFPEIIRWYAGLSALPAWQDPFPASAARAA
jgi:glutathione S-transferase